MDTATSATTVEKQHAAALRIRCESALTVATAAQLKAQLVDALHSAKSVVFDAQAVEQVDTAALQLLVAFFQDAKNQAIALSWSEPTQTLRRAVHLLGMDGALGLDKG